MDPLLDSSKPSDQGVGGRQVQSRESRAREITPYDARAAWIPGVRREGRRGSGDRALKVMAHELRTPIAGILGYAELLLAGSYGSLSEGQEDAMTRLLTSVHCLAGVVDKMVDQASLEVGMIKLRMAPLNIEELIGELCDELQPQAEAKGLELTFSIDAVPPGVFRGDRRRLRQVLVSLVENAIKFTDEGGVMVRVYGCDVEHFAVEVADTGTGISDEARTRIFDPFEIGEDPTTRCHRGIGLGLSIANGLVRQMGGIIAVESEPGRGSTFTVVLPVGGPPDEVDKVN